MIAIVDYGLGNLFSVSNACRAVGLSTSITSSTQEILAADAVILPGVGAFGDAMRTLERLDLVYPLRDIAASQKPLFGICLGMQLLMTESYEFGTHRGLDIISGRVEPLITDQSNVKVPHIGWNTIHTPRKSEIGTNWTESPLANLREGTFMYFVHSYIVVPERKEVILAESKYGSNEFCASLMSRNIFAAQFHPEKSGPDGLTIYRNLSLFIQRALVSIKPS